MAGATVGTTSPSSLTPEQDEWLRFHIRGRQDIAPADKTELESLYPMLWRLWPELKRPTPYAITSRIVHAIRR